MGTLVHEPFRDVLDRLHFFILPFEIRFFTFGKLRRRKATGFSQSGNVNEQSVTSSQLHVSRDI